MKTKTPNLFEKLKELTGCEYISDLMVSPYDAKVRKTLAAIDLSGYDCKELSDMAEYIYSEKEVFENTRQAEEYFRYKLAGAVNKLI